MAGYRSLFIRTTRALSSLLPLKGMINLSRQRLIVPVYHIVTDNPPPHIRHLYAIKSEKQFEDDLDFLLKHYAPVDFDELLKIVRNGKKTAKNTFIMTFDDGLREFYEVAAPVLKRKGIPAINFLNSSFINNKDLFFRYKACLLFDNLQNNKGLLTKKDVKNWFSGKGKDYENVLFSVSYAERHTLDELATMIGLDFASYLKIHRPYMEENEIRSLIGQGFYFGGHSCDHPEYRYIGIEEQLQQTFQSVVDVSESFHLSYRTFAFPFTDFAVTNSFFERLKAANNHIDITFGSAGLKQDPVPFHLQRIPMETAGLAAEDVLKGEYLYYFLKGVAGKNYIKRT